MSRKGRRNFRVRGTSSTVDDPGDLSKLRGSRRRCPRSWGRFRDDVTATAHERARNETLPERRTQDRTDVAVEFVAIRARASARDRAAARDDDDGPSRA